MIESGKLLDRWLPPEGAGQPIGCIATSFTFEPDFFEGECLSRFLGFDGVRGETSELSYLIEQEERLVEASVTAVVDRSQNPGNRNLRWDLLAVSPPRGLMHAKVTLLAWENLVRFLVSSANLTRPAYRSNVEVAATLDASDGSDIPRSIFDDLLAALDRILALVPEAPGAQVPVTRARETMARVERLLDGYGLRTTAPRGAPKLAIIVGSPGQPVLPQLDAVWSGPVPRNATVMSPYFDTTEDANRVGRELAGHLAKSGPRTAWFVLPAEQLAAKTIVRAPATITNVMPRGVETRFHLFPFDPQGEPRRLHARALVLESSEWAACMVGSSNFTTAGYGIAAFSYLEVNVAIGAALGTRDAKAISGLIKLGDELNTEDVEWEESVDEDEHPPPAVPFGFLSCLADPKMPPSLMVDLDPNTQRCLPGRSVLPRNGVGASVLAAEASG
jgi:HKD family nuclease